jgi:hypothetical protein
MSHDPAKIRLMIEADKLGFGEIPTWEVIGGAGSIPWKPADTSLLSGQPCQSTSERPFPGGILEERRSRISSWRK